jgi:hypothetical protein
MKIRHGVIKELIVTLSRLILDEITTTLNALDELKQTHGLHASNRDINDVTESNVLNLIAQYTRAHAVLKEWEEKNFPATDKVTSLSLFDCTVPSNKGSEKETTCFVMPFDRFPSEVVRVNGFEIARLRFRKNYNVLGNPIECVDMSCDFVGVADSSQTPLYREQQKSDEWVEGQAGYRGAFVSKSPLKVGTVTHIYKKLF